MQNTFNSDILFNDLHSKCAYKYFKVFIKVEKSKREIKFLHRCWQRSPTKSRLMEICPGIHDLQKFGRTYRDRRADFAKTSIKTALFLRKWVTFGQ